MRILCSFSFVQFKQLLRKNTLLWKWIKGDRYNGRVNKRLHFTCKIRSFGNALSAKKRPRYMEHFLRWRRKSKRTTIHMWHDHDGWEETFRGGKMQTGTSVSPGMRTGRIIAPLIIILLLSRSMQPSKVPDFSSSKRCLFFSLELLSFSFSLSLFSVSVAITLVFSLPLSFSLSFARLLELYFSPSRPRSLPPLSFSLSFSISLTLSHLYPLSPLSQHDNQTVYSAMAGFASWVNR